MPSMPRILKDKATKIAFKILGKPITMVRRTEPKTLIEKRVAYEEATKSR